MKLPFFVWSQLIAAVLLLLAFPALQAAAIFQFMDRVAGTSFFLPSGLYVAGAPLQALSVTAPFMLTFRLALTLGFILAFPVVAYQIWSFLAPALTPRERRSIVPALYLGAVLFSAGVALAYLYVLPATLGFLQGFQTPSLKLALTGDFYFGFVIKLLVAFGVGFGAATTG